MIVVIILHRNQELAEKRAKTGEKAIGEVQAVIR